MDAKLIDTNSMDSNTAAPDRYELMGVGRYEVGDLPMDSNEAESNLGTSMDSK